MTRRKFIKIEDGYVTACILSHDEEMEGFIETTGPESVGAPYDEATDTFGEPEPELKLIVKAIFLTFKANPGVTIPPKAQAIFQRLKSNWSE